nr:lysis system i-spanin subunit Rz [Pseudomonas cremoricolorata]
MLPAWLPTVAALTAGVVIGGAGAWLWQANDYSRQLAEQSADYSRQLQDLRAASGHEREQAAAAALDQIAEQQAQRRDLEERLAQQAQTHSKELHDAQQTQARLRDRLATSDLRLSVLVDAGAFAAQGCDGGVRETAGTAGLVHGAIRADLDPAHAQRIIAITDEGDRGLIALKVCQAYVRETTR